MARQNPELIEQAVAQKATVLSLEMLLRTLSRGQSFDVLSSQVRAIVHNGITVT